MTWHVFESWRQLMYLDFIMRFQGFHRLHETVRRAEVQPVSAEKQRPYEELCRAVDLACVFYYKPVLCLQRSAATTLLLRSYGWKAEMVIGAQVAPFRSHAWVELERGVINDKPYVPDIYQVLERC